MSQAVITAIAVAGILAANAVFFLSFLSVACYRARQEGFQAGFQCGVVQGWLVGRFPQTSYVDSRLKEACAITDGLEADVMWAKLSKEAKQ